MHAITPLALTLTLGVGVLGAPATAQETSGGTGAGSQPALSVELVSELFWVCQGIRGPGGPEVLAGEAPAALSAAGLVPGNAVPLAGWSWGDNHVAILKVEREWPEVRREIAERLRAGGWRDEAGEVGFLPDPDSPFLEACRDDQRYASAGLFPPEDGWGPDQDGQSSRRTLRPGEPLNVVVMLLESSDSNPYCTHRPEERSQDPFPLLYAPPGSTEHGSGSEGYISAYTSAYTRLQTDLELETLLAHYARQLVAQGWRPGPANVMSSAADQFWSFEDPAGEPWEGLFTIRRKHNSRTGVSFEVSLQITKIAP